jgi:hypothetical protein
MALAKGRHRSTIPWMCESGPPSGETEHTSNGARISSIGRLCEKEGR